MEDGRFRFLLHQLTSFSFPHYRSDFQLPSSAHMGIHERETDPKRISAMAGIRSPDAIAKVVVDRKWT